MREINFRGYPLPPSDNGLYTNAGRAFGRGKSQKYVSYIQTVRHWALINAHQLNKLREWTLEMPEKHAIRIDKMFFFRKDKILTKDLRIRKNDTFNRNKALHDTLAQLLGIDDSLFWEGFISKQPIEIEGLEECVDMVFSFVDFTRPKRIVAED